MEQIMEDLKKKVEHLQYKEIEPLKQKVSVLETNNALTEQLCRQMTKSFDKMENTMDRMDGTMDSVKETMISLNSSVDNLNSQVKEIGTKTDNIKAEFKQEVGKTNKRLDEVDNKSKIDTTVETKKGLSDVVTKLIFYVFGGGLLVYLISQIN